MGETYKLATKSCISLAANFCSSDEVSSESSAPRSYRCELLILISNLADLFVIYGMDCVHDAVFNAIKERLEPFGLTDQRILPSGEYIAVVLSEAQTPEAISDDLYLERIKAALCYQAIACGQHPVLMNVFVTFGSADYGELISAGSSAWSAKKIDPEALAGQRVAYRNDMASAVNFFAQLRAGTIVLAFQKVRKADGANGDVYSESLLRRVAADGVSLASCEKEIQALERLGLIDRLDRSVLWAVAATLKSHTTAQLACNVSALSLRHDGWWRLLQAYLVERPDVASRLTLEVTETSAISQSDEAISLLLALRLTGCRIAIDDMGAGYSTLDFLIKARPGLVKIDRSFIANSSNPQSPPDLLLHLIALCADLTPCVVVEGIESEAELKIAIDAGAHAVQGYLIEFPTICPGWLKGIVSVHDSCMPTHRSLALDNAAVAAPQYSVAITKHGTTSCPML